MSQQCSFKNKSPCGSSHYYASSEEVIHILKCEKPISQHLRGLSCDTDLQIPECLLILYRYGNFSLDSSTMSTLEKRQQRRCHSTFHPTNSNAKVERGIQAQIAKEIWMDSGVGIPVGAEELRKATDENGHKLFTKQEWLNPPQINGYIANIISKSKSSLAVKKPRAELQDVNVDDYEKLSEVVVM
ncbi:unnamed protein product [Mytilus coruscus]|uniref:Uncharacterized protein n=1 Tax=Mytilus coruscus TaxID=42192 RepID=A0A6J8D580_MYTCO|nr:unnamed protein product [Mytilus coruscus]